MVTLGSVVSLVPEELGVVSSSFIGFSSVVILSLPVPLLVGVAVVSPGTGFPFFGLLATGGAEVFLVGLRGTVSSELDSSFLSSFLG